MVFKMLNGKKKTVDIDGQEEAVSDKVYSVKTPANQKGAGKQLSPAAAKQYLNKQGMKQDRNPNKIYDIDSSAPNKGLKTPGEVNKMLKNKKKKGVGKATPTAKMRKESYVLPERLRRLAGQTPYVRPGLEESHDGELQVDDFVCELAGIRPYRPGLDDYLAENVANTIWKQIPMTTKMAVGARKPIADSDKKSLKFQVLRAPMRFVMVTLDPSDTYTVEFFRLKKNNYQKVTLGKQSGVYAEDLGHIIYGLTHGKIK